ncbi:class C beta-lactamase [Pseudomonas sp. 148P]|uniref:Beta-lactamase n=1 Tax=Pseudomonas ulcerans TaxID=3115852 RepID=A0ABU7HR48_9PSED|nr:MULTISPECIES: class C beta-lactamase [unclassified Pseudomonas]MEE1923054.1 class C beta-lactamase [Pseudomonas sp. 147P]MEE1934016.1 class C beta-lactamase [Pseudomonas sp. 148P]
MRLPTLFLLCASPLLAWAGPDLDSQVRAAAQQVMRDNDIPGLAIALTDKGKQYFYEFGVADKASGQAVSRDTLFELGSISKTFSATLAAKAAVDGKLSLQARVGDYLPALAGTPFGALSLFNLATHTNGGMPLQLPDAIHDDAQLLAWLKQWQPQHQPESWRAYANPSIGMLGAITAQRLQTPYASALQEQLLPALGLKQTFVHVPAAQQAQYAWGYDRNDKPVRVNPGVLADEAYGVKSSSRDMLRFVEANLGRVELALPLRQALEETRRGHYQRGTMTQDLVWEQYDYPLALQTLIDGNDNRYALEGTPVTALKPPLAPQSKVWVNKTGATNGFGAYVAFIPQSQRGVVLLANRNYPNAERVKLAWRLFEVLDQAR